MYFLIFGEDTYRSQKKLTSLRAKFKLDRDSSGLNEAVLRAETHDADKVAEALYASPFLADRKLVVLHGYLETNKSTQEKIAERLGSKPESTVAIFYQAGSSADLKGSPLFDVLKTERFTEEFKLLGVEQLVGLVAAECAELGMQIEMRACRELVAAVGTDSRSLHQEVSKLCAYAKAQGAGMIVMDMVHELTASGIEDSVFEFLDACTQGRSKDALNLLERMLSSGTNEMQVLSMLQRQFSSLVGAKDLLERGVNDRNEVARKLCIHPYPAGKAITAARLITLKNLKALSNELIEVERRAKTGRGKLKAEISLFAANVSRLRAGR